MTDKSHGQEVNINRIMARFVRTGTIDPNHINRRQTIFGDFSETGDYQDCIERVQQAQAEFDALPSEIRDRFDNNPAHLLDFISDEQNRSEAIELGLVNPPAPPPEESPLRSGSDASPAAPKEAEAPPSPEGEGGGGG